MSLNCKSPEEVLAAVKANEVEMVDVRFTDLPGQWQHFSVPPGSLDADNFTDGIGFDGLSIRGFQESQQIDVLVVPDPTTAFLDPFAEVQTPVLICKPLDPGTGQPCSCDRHRDGRTRDRSDIAGACGRHTSPPSMLSSSMRMARCSM